MTATLNCPVSGLESEFPDRLFLLSQPATGKWGCWAHVGTHGLCAFSTSQLALAFAIRFELAGMKVALASFDDAREIAKTRPAPIVALFLMDDPANPVVHYVR